MTTGQSEDIYARTLAVFDRQANRHEPLTTPEVATALDAERRTVYKRLRTLVDRGELETKEVGSNARVWWRHGTERSVAAAESSADCAPRDEARDGPSAENEAHTGDGDRQLRAEYGVDGIAILDEDGIYQYVTESHAAVYGYDDSAAFLGESWRMCYEDAEIARFENDVHPTLREEGTWRGGAVGQRKDGTTFPQDISMTVTDDGGIVCVVRDVTARRAQEQRLRDANRFNEELVENAPFGTFRLDEELRITYENSRAEEIIGLPEEMETSDAIGVDIRELPPIVETGQADLFSRLQDGETIEFDFPFESIYGKEAYFTGRAVPVYRDDEFDGAILMATDISERRQYERELERQREQLAALDELNDVVRGITEAVIEQSTRVEIEQVVCDRLAASDSYRFAGVGAVDARERLEPRAEAGVDGYLEQIRFTSLSVDPSEDGPIGKAVQTREIQIARHALEEDRVREDADEFDYRSLAAIPIVHQGMFYGILTICSDRPDAFAAAEREVVGQLGDVIGHAIAAVDRKRALMSNDVVELDIRIPGLLDLEEATDRVITIDRVTPLGDDEFLLYGTTAVDAVSMLETIGDRRPDWRDLRTFDDEGGEVRFEQRLSDPPMTSIVADHGGNFRTGRIEDGEYSATVQFPPGTDVGRVVDRIRETYLDVRIGSQRQVARDDPTSRHVSSALDDDLTERQRTALEAGYFGGFFEWPRHRNGEEVAASLDIGPSTFHQHVRKAERKLLDVVFDEL